MNVLSPFNVFGQCADGGRVYLSYKPFFWSSDRTSYALEICAAALVSEWFPKLTDAVHARSDCMPGHAAAETSKLPA